MKISSWVYVAEVYEGFFIDKMVSNYLYILEYNIKILYNYNSAELSSHQKIHHDSSWITQAVWKELNIKKCINVAN